MTPALLSLALFAFVPVSKSPTVPHITEVRVDKSDHTLELVDGDKVVKTYRVAIGSGGLGPKRYEGDNVTPTGTYTLSGRFNLFHRFINVSYPNADDRKRFAALQKAGGVPKGRTIGFGIGLHGTGHAEWNGVHKETDWTAGCIAVDDDEIDEIAALLPDGTKMVIQD
jgi:murein L,D-transpeptidase YafK